MLLLIIKTIYLIKISYITSHANYNFLNCDWFKRLFPTNSLAKLLSDSLLSDSLLSDSLLSDSLLSDSLLSDSLLSDSLLSDSSTKQ